MPYKLSTAALMWFARHRTKPLQQMLVIRSVKSITVTSSPAVMFAIKDGGHRSVDHGSILTHLLRTRRGQIAFTVDTQVTQRNMGILRRPHNYIYASYAARLL